MAEPTNHSTTTVSQPDEAASPVTLVPAPTGKARRSLLLATGALVLLAVVGGLALPRPKPVPVPIDPASSIKRSPGSVTVSPPAVKGAATVQTHIIKTAQPSNKVSTQVTSWQKIERQRHDALIAWRKAEAAHQERERQAAIKAAQEEAARRAELAQRAEAARQAEAQARAAAAQPSQQTPVINSGSGGTRAVQPVPAPSTPAIPARQAGPPSTPPVVKTQSSGRQTDSGASVTPAPTNGAPPSTPNQSSQVPAAVPATTPPATDAASSDVSPAPATPDASPLDNSAAQPVEPSSSSAP